MSTVTVDADRLWADHLALADITDPQRPYTRRSFSSTFLEGRRWLRARFEAAGLSCHIDPAGNLIGRMAGRGEEAGVIMSGSHSDTVPSGGRFDGISGVLAALEAVRAIRDAGIVTRHDIAVVDFLAEEPSDFGLSCIGSRGMSGQLTAEHLMLAAPWGEKLDVALGRMGGCATSLDPSSSRDIIAFFELHIEQGRVLEDAGVPIGIVEAIAGITRIEILLEGQADHAGTTPMGLRHDAAVAAAMIIQDVAHIAARLASEREGYITATTGVVEILPNAANVVPRQARLVVDLRVSRRTTAEIFLAELRATVGRAVEAARIRSGTCGIISDTLPVRCDAGLCDILRDAATVRGLASRTMVSGAGHDAAMMAAIAPSAMLFVPCRDGRSHDPQEWAEAGDLARGAQVLTDALLARDLLA
ncbi:Zn-dependent hydrolase [Gluconacetobacter sacchari]|uniref:Zn-dependent hydrolase n=1 Tax=Gluconacetobacter sacchari TaxID=92759 RepID=UPI0039B40EE1